MGEFARECELRINGNPDLKQKIDNMKAKKKLLPIWEKKNN